MPALDWLTLAKNRANKSPQFRALGSMNATICFQSGKHASNVTFKAFKVDSVTPIEGDAVGDQPIVISMSTREWNSYLYNRRMKRAPNLLSLDQERGVVKTKSTIARLDFERILKSIQEFIDLGAKSRS